MYIILYVICYILSYYTLRWLAKQEQEVWLWEDVQIAALCSILLFFVPLIYLFVRWKALGLPTINLKNPPPKWLIYIGLLFIVSCNTTKPTSKPSLKYYMQEGTLEFKNGQPTVKVSGPKILITDTVFIGTIITN